MSDLPPSQDDHGPTGELPAGEAPEESSSTARRIAQSRAVWALAPLVLIVVAVLVIRWQSSDAADIDDLCADVNERFRDDLALGDSFGSEDDWDALRERIDVLTDLRRQAENADAPEGTERPSAWLQKLDAFIDEMTLLQNSNESEAMHDMVFVLMTVEVDDAAIAAGEAAERYDLENCSQVQSWELIPGGHG